MPSLGARKHTGGCRAVPSRSCYTAMRVWAVATRVWAVATIDGTGISVDMDLIGQLQPHTSARFVETDMGALSRRAPSARHS